MAGSISYSQKALKRIYAIPELIPNWAFQFFARVAIAPVFWFSGRLKVSQCDFWDVMTMRYWWDEDSACHINNATWGLFEGDWALPFINDEVAAYAATFAEHLFPVLLILGLATRFSALALFIMTMVIQFFIYPDAWWGTHALWAFALLFIIARGPGPVSLDHVINRLFGGR